MAGQTYHCRLGRKELEREVIGAIGQGIDLIRNLLHREIGLRGRRDGVDKDGESWLQVMEWSQKSEGKLRESACGATDRRRDLILYRDHNATISVQGSSVAKHSCIEYSQRCCGRLQESKSRQPVQFVDQIVPGDNFNQNRRSGVPTVNCICSTDTGPQLVLSMTICGLA